jgi:putative transposase
LSLEVICELLEVARSSYYAWQGKKGERKDRAKKRDEILFIIEEIFVKSRKSYGAIRVHNQLVKIGIKEYSAKQVRQLMKEKGLISVHCRAKKKFICTTDSRGNKSIADNLLQREFSATAPNQKWVGDITYIWTDEGWLYLATVLDLYSRKIVGYAMSSKPDAELACNAFKMALMRRPQARELMYHSDRGSVYGSLEFRELLIKNGITPSMSRKGDCYDNAVAESFFHTIKVELIFLKVYKTRKSAILSVAEWIENFYNAERIHSTLGYRSPADYEASYSAGL